MMHAILGIDPGLGVSHAVLLGACPGRTAARRYPILAAFEIPTPEDGPLGPLHIPLAGTPPHLLTVIVVESARGTVIKGRDADPVLRNAAMSGRLTEHAQYEHPHADVLTVPAFGVHQGWNWRGEIGCGGMTDAGVAMTLARILTGTLPEGPRGGHVSHYYDAAGLAAAGLHRLQLDDGTVRTDAPAAWNTLSPLEAAVKAGVKDRRDARRKGRALQKKVHR